MQAFFSYPILHWPNTLVYEFSQTFSATSSSFDSTRVSSTCSYHSHSFLEVLFTEISLTHKDNI